MTVMVHADALERVERAMVPGFGEMAEGNTVTIVPNGRVYRIDRLFIGHEGRLMARLREKGVPTSLPIIYPADRLEAADWTLPWYSVVGYGAWGWAVVLFLLSVWVSIDAWVSG